MVEETVILTNREVAGLLSPEESIDAIESAFRQLGRKEARVLPRRRIYLPDQKEVDDHYYWFNQISGAVSDIHTMAVRLDSATVNVEEKRGNVRWSFPDDFSGIVLLYDTRTNELISILQDYYINPFRVAATSAIGVDQLSREDAEVMGIFGSGSQAALQISHVSEVRDLDTIRVYSTNPERRQDFARRMNDVVDPTVEAVDEPETAVSGCDIVTTATNSNEPVFDGEWLEPGTHVNTMIGSDSYVPRRETDDRTVEKSDLIVVNSLESVYIDKQPELYPHLQNGTLHEEDIYELPDLLVKDRIHGRSSASQITYHNNNVGMGIQFAALGRILYERATEQGLGTPVPAELFMQYDDDLITIRDQEFLHMDPDDAAEKL